jgi:hypothetical protein
LRIARASCGRLCSSSHSAAPRAGSSWRSACAARSAGPRRPTYSTRAARRPGGSRNHADDPLAAQRDRQRAREPATACWIRGAPRGAGSNAAATIRCATDVARHHVEPRVRVAREHAQLARADHRDERRERRSAVDPARHRVRAHAETMLGRTIETGRSPARRTASGARRGTS